MRALVSWDPPCGLQAVPGPSVEGPGSHEGFPSPVLFIGVTGGSGEGTREEVPFCLVLCPLWRGLTAAPHLEALGLTLTCVRPSVVRTRTPTRGYSRAPGPPTGLVVRGLWAGRASTACGTGLPGGHGSSGEGHSLWPCGWHGVPGENGVCGGSRGAQGSPGFWSLGWMGGKSVEGVLVRRPCARGAPLPGRVWGWGAGPSRPRPWSAVGPDGSAGGCEPA